MLWRYKMWKILYIYYTWAKKITGEKIKMDWAGDFYALPIYPYEIGIGIAMSDKNKNELPQFFKENFNFNFGKFELCTICFLHEIGHILTDYEFEDEEFDRDSLSSQEYRKLPKEWAADEWLVDYIKNNGWLCYKWQRKLQKAYSKISQKDLEKWYKTLKKPLN